MFEGRLGWDRERVLGKEVVQAVGMEAGWVNGWVAGGGFEAVAMDTKPEPSDRRLVE